MRFRKIFFVFFAFFLFLPTIFASENKNLVNIYLFYSNTCHHCEAEEKVLMELSRRYENVRIYKYEVSTDENFQLLNEVAELYDTKVTGVPFTVIGNKVYKGFSYDASKAKFMGTIAYYSEHGYKDLVGEYLGDIELPTYQVDLESGESLEEFLSDYGNYTIRFLGIEIETKDLSMSTVAVLLGLTYGFSPFTLLVLLFFVSWSMRRYDKRRVWSLGLIFLFVLAMVHWVLMMPWVNVSQFIPQAVLVRRLIGFVMSIGSMICLFAYFKKRKNCETGVSLKEQSKEFFGSKKLIHERSFCLAIVLVILLAIGINIVEFSYSAGQPVQFMEILSLYSFTLLEKILYIGIYLFFFLFFNFLVFFVFITKVCSSKFSIRYENLLRFVGMIIFFVVGLLLLFKPEWVSFLF